jgi:hypothetical protein
MALKDTILGWLRGTPAKREELEDAEADAATAEYAEHKADAAAEDHLGGSVGAFDSDQEAPRD